MFPMAIDYKICKFLRLADLAVTRLLRRQHLRCGPGFFQQLQKNHKKNKITKKLAR
jgi:hypothetical protein